MTMWNEIIVYHLQVRVSSKVLERGIDIPSLSHLKKLMSDTSIEHHVPHGRVERTCLSHRYEQESSCKQQCHTPERVDLELATPKGETPPKIAAHFLDNNIPYESKTSMTTMSIKKLIYGYTTNLT
jgi:hypothetical protein